MQTKRVNIDDKVMLFNINHSYEPYMTDDGILEVTQSDWVVGEDRPNGATYALAVVKGEVKGVFIIKSWSTSPETRGRRMFKGTIAQPAIYEKYIGRQVGHYFNRSTNPVRYVNC